MILEVCVSSYLAYPERLIELNSKAFATSNDSVVAIYRFREWRFVTIIDTVKSLSLVFFLVRLYPKDEVVLQLHCLF